jgi:oligopeptide/dipeptide ABC transporter ATP-binding protein
MGVIAEFAQRVVVMYAGRVVETAPVKELFRKPVHPYTEGLLAAIPKLDVDVVRLPTIRGSIPDPAQSIQGCRYSPRCPVVIGQCLIEPPALLPAGPARFARCPPRVAAP